VESLGILEAHFGGEVVATKKTDGEGEAQASLSLKRGKHLLLLELISEGESLAADLRFDVPEGFEKDLTFSVTPQHAVSLDDLLEAEAIRGVHISPDGVWLAIHLTRLASPGDSTSRKGRIEIRRVSDGSLLRTLHGGESSFQWLPDGSCYSYVLQDDELSDLWVASMAGSLERAVQGMKGLSDYSWLPDGKNLVLAISKKSEKDDRDRGVKRYQALDDRWSTWRDHDHLLLVDRSGASQRPLTAGPGDISLEDVSPDGKRLLFSIAKNEPKTRPFSFDDLYELDLETLEARLLKRVVWFGGATYGPGGFRALVRAGASAFGTLGHAVEKQVFPNQYDGQLYFLDLATEEVTTLTRSFDPAVEDAYWLDSGALVVLAQAGSRKLLYLYQPGQGFRPLVERLEDSVEAVEGLSVARQGAAVAYYGSSLDKPHRVLVQKTEGFAAPREIYVADADCWSRARWGKVEDFEVSIPAEEGAPEGAEEVVLPGRIHYPADFDPSKSYPLIVYYYGGTVPSDRDFGGRFPKNVWTSHGYVVYTPQPSGATGYGQKGSALHVNNWGRTVGGEIIEGTRAVLAAHSFLDPKRVGCLGASYGGFMTMHLLTQTDLFSAAISHAGISSLSSYWGEGWWGYLYSAVASAGSYPWNARDLYVDQSPLFSADKIVTPLLLLHGGADINVPIGESQQMYTALEILGKDVEFITFDGENHRIVDPAKKKIWSETILAWFDWKLKGQEEWWRHLYGSEVEPKGVDKLAAALEHHHHHH
jgi:dipeptidyl aminopeptidase/acylaminoacyl peptidase